MDDRYEKQNEEMKNEYFYWTKKGSTNYFICEIKLLNIDIPALKKYKNFIYEGNVVLLDEETNEYKKYELLEIKSDYVNEYGIERVYALIYDCFRTTMYKNLYEITNFVSNFFRTDINSMQKLLMGNFGELIFIYKNKKHLLQLLDGYSINKYEHVDFNLGEKLLFEVKSALNGEHKFLVKLDQINKSKTNYLVCVELFQSSKGITISDLLKDIEKEISNQNIDLPSSFATIQNTKNIIEIFSKNLNIEDYRMDIGKTNIRIHKVEDIPTVTVGSELITELQYKVNVSNIISYSLPEILK